MTKQLFLEHRPVGPVSTKDGRGLLANNWRCRKTAIVRRIHNGSTEPLSCRTFDTALDRVGIAQTEAELHGKRDAQPLCVEDLS